MKKLAFALVLAVAALATAGQIKNPSNPLVFHGKRLAVTPDSFPFPTCPPVCIENR